MRGTIQCMRGCFSMRSLLVMYIPCASALLYNALQCDRSFVLVLFMRSLWPYEVRRRIVYMRGVFVFLHANGFCERAVYT